jgi:hypothetical protein
MTMRPASEIAANWMKLAVDLEARNLAQRIEIERLRDALKRIQNAPMVVDGGSIQWCRVVAQKALENRT